jgi:hypothetical protein
VLHHLDALAVFFAPLAYGYDGASQGCEASEFLLDILQAFVALAVRDLIHRAAALLPPVLLILLVNFGDFRPQTHDLILENS